MKTGKLSQKGCDNYRKKIKSLENENLTMAERQTENEKLVSDFFNQDDLSRSNSQQ